MSDILIDTCAAIWILADAPIRTAAQERLAEAAMDKRSSYVSPISAWEMGLLVARGRIALPFSPGQWYRDLVAIPLTAVAPLTEDVLIESHFLPGRPPNDPPTASSSRPRGAMASAS